MSDTWEIRFNLQAEDKLKTEAFHFQVNSLQDSSHEFPSFPKDKMLRALREHGKSDSYKFARGHLRDLKLKKCKTISPQDELHIMMLVYDKIGPITVLFTNKFEYLVLEGIDNQYNYLGYKTLVNLLLQTIKPETEPIQGVGKLKAVYHASNVTERTRKASYTPILETTEGNLALFILSIALPTIAVIILPRDWLDSTLVYISSLALLSILICVYPIVKRSPRHAPLALISLILSYVLIETLIHFHILVDGVNPWGIFNNISRHNLVGILRNQPIIASISPQIFIGFDLLGAITPFLDIILLALIPFAVGGSISAFLEKSESKLSFGKIVKKTFFAALFLIFILVLPLGYHVIGKGIEGTLYASIGVTETSEILSDRFYTNLAENLDELQSLIESASFYFAKAGNSFQQFAQNPLIAYLLPSIIPEVSGIPLQDLPKILNLTYVVSNALVHFPNVLWAMSNLESGMNLTFSILQESITVNSALGFGSSIQAVYNPSMKDALKSLSLGKDNLSYIQEPLLDLFAQTREKLDYSVFAEISTILADLELMLPVLIVILDSLVPWVNSTYKLTLVIDDLFDFKFNSTYLTSAESDFHQSDAINEISLTSLPEESLIPIRDLAEFSINLHSVAKYFLFSIQNGTQMFQQLNTTLRLFDDVDFLNSSNIDEPIWNDIQLGLTNTSSLLNATQDSLSNMSTIVNNSQRDLEFEILNDFLGELTEFIDDTSDQFNVVDQYFSALDGTFNSISHFSAGMKALNQTITQDLITNTTIGNYTEARNNFTLSQSQASNTNVTLSDISTHLLNESSVSNWISLLVGENNSIYVNAGSCLSLISGIETIGFVLTTHLQQLDLIKVQTENLDWNIFTF
jgi:hypothetical protein